MLQDFIHVHVVVTFEKFIFSNQEIALEIRTTPNDQN